MESMIAWHWEAQAKVMGLTLQGTLSEVLNMMLSEHDHIGNTINGSNCKVFNILIIFSFITTQFFI